jgi:hypothetical protein
MRLALQWAVDGRPLFVWEGEGAQSELGSLAAVWGYPFREVGVPATRAAMLAFCVAMAAAACPDRWLKS